MMDDNAIKSVRIPRKGNKFEPNHPKYGGRQPGTANSRTVRALAQATLDGMSYDDLQILADRVALAAHRCANPDQRRSSGSLRFRLRRALLDAITIAPLNDWQTGAELLAAGTQLTHEILLTLSVREMGYLPLPPGARERVIDILAREAAKERRLAGRKLKY